MKLLNKLTGQLEEVPDSEAEAAVLGSGGTLDFPDEAELERGGRLEQFGSGGQQALGALESLTRTATFGVIPGFGSKDEIAGRERTLREESPGVSFGAQAAGSFIPGMGAAGLATRGLKLAGAGARLAGAGAVLAEGATTGLAEEVEQARFEERAISPGNVLLYGVGGELAGRALPAVLRRGAAKVMGDPLAAITGEGAQNVATLAEKRSLQRAARDAPRMPKGPERDAVLARTADEQYDRASREMRQSLDDGFRRFAATEDVAPAQLKGLVAKDSPVQLRWGTETSEQLGELSKAATGKTRKALDDVAKELLDAEKGHAIFTAARNARKTLAELPASAERDAALQSLKQGTARVDLWGKAAELDADLARTADVFAEVGPALRRELGQGDAIDPAKIRSMLKKDKLGRTLSEEKLSKLAQAFEDRAAVHAKWNTGGSSVIEQLKKDAAKLRGATAIADDVQAAVMSAPKPKGAKAPKASGFGGEALETIADMGLAAVGLPPVAGMLRKAAPAAQRLRAMIDRRKGQTGAVEIGGKRSPVDLSDKTLRDLGALDDPTTFKPETLEALRTGKGGVKDFAEDFGASGRVRQTGQAEQGIQIEMGPKGPRLVDGRHRLMVGREKGLTEVYGQVYDGARAPGKKPIYEGPIPIAKSDAPGRLRSMIDRRTGQSGHVTIGRKHLTDEQIEALQVYAERGHLDMSPEMVELIDDAFKSAELVRPGRVYRGLDMSADGLSEGDVIPAYSGYQSTSTSRNAAEVFSNEAENSTLLVISDAEGLPVTRKRVSATPEDEVLLPRDTAFRVSKIEKKRPDLTPEQEEIQASIDYDQKVLDDIKKSDQLEHDTPDYDTVGKEEALAAWERHIKAQKEELRAIGGKETTVVHVSVVPSSEAGFARTGPGVRDILTSPMGLTAGVGLAGVGALAAFHNLDANGRAAIKETARRIIKPSGEPRELSESTALSRFTGEYPGPRESYEAKREMLGAIMRDPGVLAQAISESFGTLPAEDPSLASKLAGRLMTSFHYVSDNMPASVATSLIYPRGVPPSESSLRDFAMLWSSVMEPETVLDDLEEGLATPAQIQALREVHPDIYADLLQNVVDQVATNFGEIPSNTKSWLDILFDADGLAGPSFSWRAADMIGRSYEESRLRGGPQNAGTLDASLNAVATPTAGINALQTSVTNKGA